MVRESLEQPSQPNRVEAVESVMAIHQHPIHPMLVAYPIAFLSLLSVADILYLWLEQPFWAQAALWLNIVGFSLGVLAGIVGTLDMMSIRSVRRHISAWNHFIAAVMMLAMAASGIWLRLPDPEAAIWPWGLFQSLVTALLVAVAGWLGGTLTFRHGIGVYGQEKPLAEEESSNDSPPRA